MNISPEVIKTACKSLRDSREHMKWQLTVSLPNGKLNPDRKEIIERQLEEVEQALYVFESLNQQRGEIQ